MCLSKWQQQQQKKREKSKKRSIKKKNPPETFKDKKKKVFFIILPLINISFFSFEFFFLLIACSNFFFFFFSLPSLFLFFCFFQFLTCVFYVFRVCFWQCSLNSASLSPNLPRLFSFLFSCLLFPHSLILSQMSIHCFFFVCLHTINLVGVWWGVPDGCYMNKILNTVHSLSVNSLSFSSG